MALKKVKTLTTVENINSNTNNTTDDGFNAIYPNSTPINQTYNSPISYFNENNTTEKTDSENEEIQEEIVEEYKKIQEPIIYNSKDDISSVLRTSKIDAELNKDLIVNLGWNKFLNPQEYPGKVKDVYIEEVNDSQLEKYKRVHFDLELMNDEPVEPVNVGLTAKLKFDYNSKLSRVTRAIFGEDITGYFNLKTLVGKKVLVKTKVLTNKKGMKYHAIDTIKKA